MRKIWAKAVFAIVLILSMVITASAGDKEYGLWGKVIETGRRWPAVQARTSSGPTHLDDFKRISGVGHLRTDEAILSRGYQEEEPRR